MHPQPPLDLSGYSDYGYSEQSFTGYYEPEIYNGFGRNAPIASMDDRRGMGKLVGLGGGLQMPRHLGMGLNDSIHPQSGDLREEFEFSGYGNESSFRLYAGFYESERASESMSPFSRARNAARHEEYDPTQELTYAPMRNGKNTTAISTTPINIVH